MLIPWRVSIFKLQIPRWDPMRLGVDHMPESEHDFVGQSRMKNEQTITHLFHGVSHYPPFTPPQLTYSHLISRQCLFHPFSEIR